MEHNHKDMKHIKMEGIQTMKSTFNLCCVCAIAMLVLSNAAFAAIQTSSSYDGDYYNNAAFSASSYRLGRCSYRKHQLSVLQCVGGGRGLRLHNDSSYLLLECGSVCLCTCSSDD